MSKSKLEYLWLDGYKPVANLRGKTKIIEDFSGKLEDVPMWGFDGSTILEISSSICLAVASLYGFVKPNSFSPSAL
jgi:glutamine synthetase